MRTQLYMEWADLSHTHQANKRKEQDDMIAARQDERENNPILPRSDPAYPVFSSFHPY